MKIWYLTPWPKQEKDRALLSLVDLTFEWYEDTMVFRVSIFFFFLFRNDGKNGNIDENDFRHCYGNISKLPYWKLLDHSYV